MDSRRTFAAAFAIVAGLAVAAPAGADADPWRIGDVAPAAMVASANREVKIGAEMVTVGQPYVEDCPNCGPGGTPTKNDRCTYAVFVQFPDVAGASAYNVVVRDNHPRVNATRDYRGPPFNDNHEGFKTPGGSHWFGGLTGGSGPGACPSDAHSGRFEILRAVAIFDDSARIVGRVVDTDGQGVPGVTVRASGPQSASAATDASGAYSMKVKKGTYSVSAKGYCAGQPGSSKCRTTATLKVTKGPSTADFHALYTATASGVVRDEFGRGISGVRVALTGPDGATQTTGADGAYRLRVAQKGTYELTATGSGHGPHERYYIVQNGQPSEGTAADVTFGDVKEVTLDWELDRRLQFELDGPAATRADGFSRMPVVLRATTQHGDPAPGVELDIDPSSDAHPRAVICTADSPSQPLWPSLQSDGSVSPVGFPRGKYTTTDADGTVPFIIFPGTEPGTLTITGNRHGDVSSVFAEQIPFDKPKIDQLDVKDLRKALNAISALGEDPGSPDVILEVLAELEISGQAGGIDAVPVVAEGERTIALFTRGQPPPERSDGTLEPADGVLVPGTTFLDGLVNASGFRSIRDWAAGRSIGIDRRDRRTYLGWPLPTRRAGGVGTCLEGSRDGGVALFAAHSPVTLMVTDAQGRRLGVDAKGKRHSEAQGIAFRHGTESFIAVPGGSYRLTVVGTGSGPVVLESHGRGGDGVARFSARKGAAVTLASADGTLPAKFGFAGQSVRTTTGIPLSLRGAPKRLRAGKVQKVKLSVTDALGRPVPTATLSIEGAAFSVGTDAKGRFSGRLPGLRKGTRTLVASAPGMAPVRVKLRVLPG